MLSEVIKFFNGDQLAADVWNGKYKYGEEKTPRDMFQRHLKELSAKEIERMHEVTYEKMPLLSKYGKIRFHERTRTQIISNLQKYLNFDNVVLAGSPMQGIGRHELFSTLSNCFVVGFPYDSYSGINKKEDEITQLMKRRGGAGLALCSIRPNGATVHNQASFSSGVVIFAEGYSNKTLQIAQLGRRGALMLGLSIQHPDSPEFITSKQDLTKITGANISVMIPDDFMEAVEADSDYILHFPIDSNIDLVVNPAGENNFGEYEYNELIPIISHPKNKEIPQYIKRVRAREVWDTLIQCAWTTAEPGIIFTGNWAKGGTDWVYPQYRPVATNPCSEIPMQPYDACRLLSVNMFKLVINPFTDQSAILLEKVYESFYEQVIIGDLLVDLELDYIQRIIDKINSGEDPQELKESEILVWEKVRKATSSSRRIGAGFTAFGDMLAALDKPYYSPSFIKELFKTKMRAELDATIDLAILYGTFEGFDYKLEKQSIYNQRVISKEFPEQYERMLKYGRRNVSWSTAAPTGSLSLMTQTTSGIEPLFKAFYKRRKKCIVPSDRVDFIDKSDGQKFSEYFVLHPKFIEWFATTSDQRMQVGGAKVLLENMKEKDLVRLFKMSPWFENTADDLLWEQRIEIQSIVQTYTTHAISSTINLPKNVEKSRISDIYLKSWKSGLKGNTVYRDGSRDGILSTSDKFNEIVANDFVPLKAIKRPQSISANYHTLNCNKKVYSIIIGLLQNRPYEIFIISEVPNLPQVIGETHEFLTGEIVKEDKNWYNFVSPTFTVKEISDVEHDEKMTSILLSSLMSHRTPIKDIIKVLDKTRPIAGSFTHRLIKILTQYIPNEEFQTEKCPNCDGELKHDNGCITCIDCGWSKC